jgi:hypothetical protein
VLPLAVSSNSDSHACVSLAVRVSQSLPLFFSFFLLKETPREHGRRLGQGQGPRETGLLWGRTEKDEHRLGRKTGKGVYWLPIAMIFFSS